MEIYGEASALRQFASQEYIASIKERNLGLYRYVRTSLWYTTKALANGNKAE